MQNSILSPCSVVSYSKDYLVELIRHKTGWNQRDEVSDKIQLNYLDQYLRTEHIKCETIIVEDEYIDRHYLEDYSEYYARCFPSHPRKCSRLHFFSININEAEFLDGLSSNKIEFHENLSENYIGFIVIRPIPHTFLAKVCLKPYDALISGPDHKLITKKITISLFGISLTVETTPFIEQDKVVSACATSALWTAISASSYLSDINLPSPSSITKSASHPLLEATRTFPTAGLTPIQVARSLKHFGLEPTIHPLSGDNNFSDLKELLYSYINSGTPVLIGGDIYHINSEEVKQTDGRSITVETLQYLGKHLICAVGLHIEKGKKSDGPSFLSHEIDKIYVHDDRYGPFVKIKMDPENIIFKSNQKCGLVLSLHNKKVDLFIPEIAVIGLYHKIRIPYNYIRQVFEAFYDYLLIAQQEIFYLLAGSATLDDKLKSHLSESGNSISIFLEGISEISLTTSTIIKEELLQTRSFATFNGALDKNSLLLKNFPKYIWRCRIYSRLDTVDTCFSDIFFDATEVPQGRVLIGYISYSAKAQRVWSYVEERIKDRSWKNNIENNETMELMGCFIKFFSELKEKSYLNTTYGTLGLPRRSLKNGEADLNQNIKARKDTLTVRRGGDGAVLSHLDKNIKYIWVINEIGDIVLGEDVHHGEEYEGHPTLIDGGPGRVAGEIFYSQSNNCWLLNHKSRAYSSHLMPKSELGKRYLRNIIDLNFSNFPIKIDNEAP